MNPPSFHSIDKLTVDQAKVKEYDRLDDECKVLTREIDDLRTFLVDIIRCLDDPDNNASQVEILEDIKAGHERRISEKETLMGEKMRRMTWLRRYDDRFDMFIRERDASKDSGSDDENSPAEKDTYEKHESEK